MHNEHMDTNWFKTEMIGRDRSIVSKVINGNVVMELSQAAVAQDS